MDNYNMENYKAHCLPDWATGLNITKQPVVGAQLCTKDGRRVGNGFIADIQDHYKYGGSIYKVVTDKGNALLLTESELLEMYWVGDYICKPDHNVVKED